jgi:membrane protein YdbS with pleckstrin-like domain
MASFHLGAGEHVVWTGHTHVKALAWPAFAFLVLAVGVGAGLAYIPERFSPWGPGALCAVAVLLFVILCLAPFLRWFTTVYTVTNRRIITRQGILTKIGHDLPLVRVNNVETNRGLTDRLLGCGTIQLTTAAEDPVTLPDVPHVEKVHVMIADLLFAHIDGDVGEAREDH